jgi:alanine racemase
MGRSCGCDTSSMHFPTWVEVDLDRLEDNWRSIRGRIGPDVAVLHVIKADGYGHGAVELGRVAFEQGAAMVGIATLHEGIELRQAGLDGPILILSPSLAGEMDEIVAWGLRPALSTRDQAEAFSALMTRTQGRLPVHLEIDTGMGRTGFDYETAEEEVVRLAALPGLELEGLFTHFPDSDGPDPTFTLGQVVKFRSLLQRLEARGLSFRFRHAANSAGVLSFEDSLFNMVRPGIAILGIYPSSFVTHSMTLKPILSFHCRLVQIRDVPAGRHISYGSTYVTEKPSPIGVIAAGYGHGLPRSLSNRGQVMIRGRRVPIVGRVTMDLTMVDLTGCPEAAVGDDVLLFGEPAETEAASGAAAVHEVHEPIRIEEVAEWAGTIPWEIMCQIDKRVVRKYVRGGRTVKIMTLVGERMELDDGARSGVIYAGSRRSIRASSSGYWR